MMELKKFEREKKRPFILFSSMILVLLVVSLAYSGNEKAASPYEEKLLSHINEYRLENGLNALSFDEALNKFAKVHCQHMESTDKLDHTGFDERFKQCGRSLCVENIGWNFMTPEAQFKAWKHSRGHNENMLNKQIRHAGISKIGPYVTFFACD
jgi:uncharacterized protein YkwD